jgi:pre-mRNA-splicing factor ISY1
LTSSAPTNQAKRKAADQDGDAEMSDSMEESSKRSKQTDNYHEAHASVDDTSDPQVAHARAAAAFIPFLAPENLLPPKLPTREEMEGVLLNLRKQALVEEYFGNGEEQKDQN